MSYASGLGAREKYEDATSWVIFERERVTELAGNSLAM